MGAPKKEIRIATAGEPISHYTDGVLCGDLLFLSGQVGVDGENNVVGVGDPAAQSEQMHKNIKAVLDAAGMGFENIVNFEAFLPNTDDRPKINPARQKNFGDFRPASTLVECSALAFPELLVEAECMAYKPSDGGAPRKELRLDGFPTPLSHYTDVVDCGDFAFLAGACPFDADGGIVGGDDIRAQARVALENLRKMLASVDMGFEDVARVIVFLPNVHDRHAVNELRQEFFGEHRPASTLIGIPRLAVPGMNIEIESVAYKPKSGGPKRKEIRLAQLNEPISHYTDGVQCGDFLFLSGAGPWTGDLELVGGDDIAAQCDKTLSNLGEILAAASMGFEDVVKVTVYLDDVADRTIINPVREKYFGNSRPASTLIAIDEFALEGMRIEIDAVAYKPGSGG